MSVKSSPEYFKKEIHGMFTWGFIQEIHHIDAYYIVEASDRHDKTLNFHVYLIIDEEPYDTCNTFSSLYEALLYAIALHKLDNPNEAAAFTNFACKMLS